jgi:hypothetical protein
MGWFVAVSNSCRTGITQEKKWEFVLDDYDSHIAAVLIPSRIFAPILWTLRDGNNNNWTDLLCLSDLVQCGKTIQ